MAKISSIISQGLPVVLLVPMVSTKTGGESICECLSSEDGPACEANC